MKYAPPNPKRGIVSLIAITLIFVGASFQWGVSSGLCIIGLLLYIDCVVDNAVERFTDTTNWG